MVMTVIVWLVVLLEIVVVAFVVLLAMVEVEWVRTDVVVWTVRELVSHLVIHYNQGGL